MVSLFVQVSLLIVLATIAAIVFHSLNQPSVLAYLLTGIVAGPLVLNLVPPGALLPALSTFGIAFLLFLVGL